MAKNHPQELLLTSILHQSWCNSTEEVHPNLACTGALGGNFSGSSQTHRDRQLGLGMKRGVEKKVKRSFAR